MESWKENWPDKLFKIIMAILSIAFGVNEYSAHQEHEAMKHDLYKIETYLSADDGDIYVHTDVLPSQNEE